MNTTYNNYLKNPSMQAFQFKPVDKETVFKTIDMLQPKLSCSIDDISVKLLKTIKTEIYKSITLIINQMLATGIFPENLNLQNLYHFIKKTTIPFSTITDPYQSYLPSQNFLNALSLINFMTTFILISYIIAANTASGNRTPLNLLLLN